MTQQTRFISIPESKPKPISFRDWQVREGYTLYRHGANQMSHTDLIAHLIRDHQLAEKLMEHFGSITTIANASPTELKAVKGISAATAETICVAFELSKRVSQAQASKRPKISDPADVFRLLYHDMAPLKKEVLKVLLLNTKNRVFSIEEVFIGSLNASIIHPREVFLTAIRQSAASIILAHNHPSQDPAPSKEDIASTQALVKAGTLIQIPVLDHVIIGQTYFSMKAEGLI